MSSEWIGYDHPVPFIGRDILVVRVMLSLLALHSACYSHPTSPVVILYHNHSLHSTSIVTHSTIPAERLVPPYSSRSRHHFWGRNLFLMLLHT